MKDTGSRMSRPVSTLAETMNVAPEEALCHSQVSIELYKPEVLLRGRCCIPMKNGRACPSTRNKGKKVQSRLQLGFERVTRMLYGKRVGAQRERKNSVGNGLKSIFRVHRAADRGKTSLPLKDRKLTQRKATW